MSAIEQLLENIGDGVDLKSKRAPFEKSPFWDDWKVLFATALNAEEPLQVLKVLAMEMALIGDMYASERYALRNQKNQKR